MKSLLVGIFSCFVLNCQAVYKSPFNCYYRTYDEDLLPGKGLECTFNDTTLTIYHDNFPSMSKKIDFGGRFEEHKKEASLMKTFTSELCDEFYFVERIHAENQGIQRFEKGAFRNCENLQELRLSRNHLTSLTDLNLFKFRETRNCNVVLAKNSLLKILDLSGNHLTDIDPDVFLPLYSLEELNLNSNNLESFPIEKFSKIPSLKKLYISENQFTELDATKIVEKFPNLEHIEICPNSQIESIKMHNLVNYFNFHRIDTNEKDCFK